MPEEQATGNGSTNQRVTNAELQRDIRYLTQTIQEDREETRRYRAAESERIRLLEIGQAEFRTQIIQLQKEDKILCDDVETAQQTANEAKQQSAWWNGANSLGVIMSAVMGALGLRQP